MLGIDFDSVSNSTLFSRKRIRNVNNMGWPRATCVHDSDISRLCESLQLKHKTVPKHFLNYRSKLFWARKCTNVNAAFFNFIFALRVWSRCRSLHSYVINYCLVCAICLGWIRCCPLAVVSYPRLTLAFFRSSHRSQLFSWAFGKRNSNSTKQFRYNTTRFVGVFDSLFYRVC